MTHTRKCAPEDFIVLKVKKKVVKEQSKVVEIFNDYFTNTTRYINTHEHSAFRDQSHVSGIPVAIGGSTSKVSFHLTNYHAVKRCSIM